MTLDDLPFPDGVWGVDFEFNSDPCGRPAPVCMVARELRSGRTIRLWEDEFGPAPPFPTGPTALFVAFFASAEVGCHLALKWPVPARILDLFTEHRCAINGPKGAKASLLAALDRFGLGSINACEKTEMRQLAMRGGPWTADERHALLAYCETDVDTLQRLLPAMLPHIELPYALLRGRYMAASARMEWTGIPLDVETLDRLHKYWPDIQEEIIEAIDKDFEVKAFRCIFG
jgi:hypothetical protein